MCAVEATVCVCAGRGLSELLAGLARGPVLTVYPVCTGRWEDAELGLMWGGFSIGVTGNKFLKLKTLLFLTLYYCNFTRIIA